MRLVGLLSLFLVFGTFAGAPAAADLIGDDVLIEQNTTSAGTLRDDLVTVVEGMARDTGRLTNHCHLS